MKLEERLKASDYLLLLLIVVAFAAVSWIYQINQFFSYDQTQMLLKGYYAAFTGTYLPFGNEASTMGNLPGMLSSWVIGFPLTMYMHPYAPAVFQTIVRMVGILIFANAISQLFSRRIVLLGTFIFALSPWTLYQTMLYNPAYLTFCAPLVLNCLIRLRNERHEHRMRDSGAGRFFASAILVIAIGMVVQLHFSWPVLVAGAGILWLRRDIKVSYTGILAGAAIVGFSLWPYIQEVMNNPNLLNNPESYSKDRYIGYGLVHVYPIFKGLLYWLRFASFSITQKAIVPDIEDEYSLLVVILCWVWIILSQFAAVITVIVAAYSNLFALSGVKAGANADKVRFVRGLTISYILAVIIASAASPVVLNFWQIAVVMPFAMIPLLAWISVRHNYIRTYFIAALVFFTFANAIGAARSDKFDINHSFDKGLYANCVFGFSPAQCDVMAPNLNAQQKAEVQAKYPFNQGIYDRVVKGLIPDHDGNLKPLQHFTLPLLGGDDSDTSAVTPEAAQAAPATPAAAAPAEDTANTASADAEAASEATDKAEASKADADKTETDKTETAKAADAKAAKTNDKAVAAEDKKAKAETTKDAKANDKAVAAKDKKAKAETAKEAKSNDKAVAAEAKKAKADDKAVAESKDAKTAAKGEEAAAVEAAAKDVADADAAEAEAEPAKVAVPELSEAYKRVAHSKLLEQAFPTLSAEIQNKTSKGSETKVSGAGVLKSAANEPKPAAPVAVEVITTPASNATKGAAAINASEAVVGSSAKNESKSTNQAQGSDRKDGSGSIVKANAPIIIDRAPATKPASTGVIVDAGSGDSGELIIN